MGYSEVYSVKLHSGARFAMLPPGVSAGAETNQECYRVYRRDWHGKRPSGRDSKTISAARLRTAPTFWPTSWAQYGN